MSTFGFDNDGDLDAGCWLEGKCGDEDLEDGDEDQLLGFSSCSRLGHLQHGFIEVNVVMIIWLNSIFVD